MLPVRAMKYTKAQYLSMTHIREGDKIIVQGRIFKQNLKFWKRDIFWIKADHIYNETLEFGY